MIDKKESAAINSHSSCLFRANPITGLWIDKGANIHCLFATVNNTIIYVRASCLTLYVFTRTTVRITQWVRLALADVNQLGDVRVTQQCDTSAKSRLPRKCNNAFPLYCWHTNVAVNYLFITFLWKRTNTSYLFLRYRCLSIILTYLLHGTEAFLSS